ncbi:helix-turn-helix transcriptional regulator [Streptomyces sp. NBC_00078]|uniref:helix-turn-helix domain-containing protein n=1 Tax=Streptomyces sp. NBC_00078 TaxID=2975643 RepID=UPI00338DD0EE
MRIRRDRLRELRRLRGMTQSQLAAVLGCSRGAVSTWETTGRLPLPERLQALCVFFGVSVRELVEAEESEFVTLRGLRIAAGMRMKDIAAVLKVCPPTYCDVETGRQKIPVRWVTPLSNAYGVPPETVIGLAPSRAKGETGGASGG